MASMTSLPYTSQLPDDELLDRLMRRQNLYAMIDACDMPGVPARLRPLGEKRARCLYDGLENAEDWAIGPWLALLDHALLAWIRTELPMDSWGVLVVSQHSFPALFAHLQQFVTVESPDGDRWLFRFYDPRVLPEFLASATADERKAFMSGIQRAGRLSAGPIAWHDAP